MARIRKIEISNFRGIKEFSWHPTAGINCLIGPGDSGKTSILDAIDLALGARRNIQFTDADFHALDVSTPISITITIGELDDSLKSMDTYGMFLRSFDSTKGVIEDEPESSAETVLTLNLTVASDLEPSWTLISDRASAQGVTRNLAWSDRMRITPTRIGALTDYNLAWRRGSVLNRLSEERPDASSALVKAARDARVTFGDETEKELEETLAIVVKTANELGVPIGGQAKALLDAHSVSFSGGTVSLHDKAGVPLRDLGTGSTRLLIAGLQRAAAAKTTIVLVDELEHGLEPHRIIRLLGSLGAKETFPPLQAFVTTHSPVALRELSGNQLFAMRNVNGVHRTQAVGVDNDTQSTIRLFPDAFLAPSVIICEGASEVGLLRGLDYYRTTKGEQAITALGTALIDSGGGDTDRPFKRASAFLELGYRVAVVRDDDQAPTEAIEQAFKNAGGSVFTWRSGRALEVELFHSLSDAGVSSLIERAVEIHGDDLINNQIKSASSNAKDLNAIQIETIGGISTGSRTILGNAAKTKKAGWFKSVTWMEGAAYDIIGPDLPNADPDFQMIINDIFSWTANVRD